MTSETRQDNRERGATAVEYGVLIALIGLIIVAGVGLFGESVNDWYGRMVATLSTIF